MQIFCGKFGVTLYLMFYFGIQSWAGLDGLSGHIWPAGQTLYISVTIVTETETVCNMVITQISGKEKSRVVKKLSILADLN